MMSSSVVRINNPYADRVLKQLVVDDMMQPDEGMGAAHPSGLSDSEADEIRSATPRHDDCDDLMAPHQTADGMDMPRASTQFYEELAPQLPFFEYNMLTSAHLPQIPLVQLQKLFVGQIPYHLNVSNVSWILTTLTGGRPVFHVEKIIKWTENKRACGCFHVWILPEDVEAFSAASHTALCETEGIWLSRCEEETAVLRDWCEHLKVHKEARAPLMPYQMVTIERANSDYRRPHGRRGGAARRVDMMRQTAQYPVSTGPAVFSGLNCGAAPSVFPTHAYPMRGY